MTFLAMLAMGWLLCLAVVAFAMVWDREHTPALDERKVRPARVVAASQRPYRPHVAFQR
jgi:hypothetical protein